MRLSRRRLLTGSAAAFGLPLLAAATASIDRRLLVVFAEGGWDPLFTIDPKLGVRGVDGPMPDDQPFDPLDGESVVTFGNIPVQINERQRPNVTTLFANHHRRICVVNGIWVGGLTHYESRIRVLTGTVDRDAADLATVVGHTKGVNDALGMVDFSGLGRFGAYAASTVRFGLEGQMRALVDPTARMRAVRDEEFRSFTFDDADRAALNAYLLTPPADDPIAARPGGAELLASRAEALDRAERLRSVIVPAGSTPSLEQQLTTALDLLESGACHAAMVKSDGYWDTHIDQPAQHLLWNALAGELELLISKLETRGLLDTVTVAVLSEMGRTPVRNADNGADHWPHTGAILFGAGVAGDRVIGATDDAVHSVPVDLESGEPTPKGAYIRPENLVAGLLETLDVDPGDWVPGAAPLRGFRA